MSVKVLVTGFGAFPGVPRNPTELLVRELDGTRAGPAELVGLVLPVSYERGPAEAIARARELEPSLVLGFGVATARDRVCVERRGRGVAWGRPDVDQRVASGLPPGDVAATVDCARLAELLGAELSDDAGEYVCNAWLHRVAAALHVPVGFVHVPPSSIPAERVRQGLAALLAA